MQQNSSRQQLDNFNDNMVAKYEESAADLTSVKGRITVYDQTDRFGLRELSQPTSDEKP